MIAHQMSFKNNRHGWEYRRWNRKRRLFRYESYLHLIFGPFFILLVGHVPDRNEKYKKMEFYRFDGILINIISMKIKTWKRRFENDAA